MSTRFFAREICTVLVTLGLFCSNLAPAAAQSGRVGAISGTVQDATGSVIPGVTVTLSNPGTIGGKQEAVTDGRGFYQFTRLVPSRTYTVTAALAGFRTLERQAIAVNTDQTTRVDLIMEVGELSETLTVSGEAPLLDTTSALNQTVLEREIVDKLPTGGDVWSIGRMVPSVIMGKYDVGGNQSMAQSTGLVNGSQQSEGAFLIDGTETSNSSNPGVAGGYYDAFAFQEINYQAGNTQAEFDRGGLVYTLVTRTGTNVFHGYFSSLATSSALGSDNITPELRSDLLAAVPPRVLAANPDLEPVAGIETMYNVGAGISGPIVQNSLWFSVTGQRAKLDQFRLGSYNSDGTQMVDRNKQYDYSIKVSGQVNNNNQIHYLHRLNNRVGYNRTLSQLTTANDFYETNATRIQTLPSPMDQVSWKSTLSSKLLLEAMASRFVTTQTGDGRQAGVELDDIARFDSVTSTYAVAQPTYSDQRWDSRKNVQFSASYFAGSHDVKIGYQFVRNSVDSETFGIGYHPAGIRAVHRDGVPSSVNTYNTPTGTNLFTQDQSVYVQDKWTAAAKLTLNLGLRLQKTNGWVPATCQEETIFISAQCFDSIEDVPNWLDLSPRFGLVYDLFGDGRTALKFAANRYYIGIYTAHPGRVNPVRLTNDTRNWIDDGDLIPELNELGPSSGYNLGTTNRYNPDLKRPAVNEYSAEIERQLFPDFVVSLAYVHRATRRNIGSRNLLVPTASYTPLLVTERNSGEQVTVYNQDPSTRGRFDVLFDNESALDANYHGVNLTGTKRLSNGWMLMGGVSVGKNEGDIYGVSDMNDPNFMFRRGVLSSDVPFSAKIAGFYDLPYGFTFSANVQHFTGFPEIDTVTVSSNTVALTQVSQSVTIQPAGTNRLPSVNMFDIGGRRTFRMGNGLTVEPVVQVFNLMNANTTQGRATVLGPAYHRVAAILPGRTVRFDLFLKF